MIRLWKVPGGVGLDAYHPSCEDKTIAKRQPGFWAWPVRYYLLVYEWRLFGAFGAGEYQHALRKRHRTRVSADESRAVLKSAGFLLHLDAGEEGVELTLTVTNRSRKSWPKLASIVPCMNPGDFRRQAPRPGNSCFVDDEHQRTFFCGLKGLELLRGQDIHFNNALGEEVQSLSPNGKFSFSRSRGVWGPQRWETSATLAHAGLMVRESIDGTWVAGVAWEDFLSAQGHNPYRCMHLAVHIGPLAPSESRTIRGKIYLFRGSKVDCYSRFREDFPSRS
jgi:hypothetical protein